jgi:hypothetical protein
LVKAYLREGKTLLSEKGKELETGFYYEKKKKYLTMDFPVYDRNSDINVEMAAKFVFIFREMQCRVEFGYQLRLYFGMRGGKA